ncbi:MAG TPA: TatD family hydrolase [Opitutaceae bacterium]|nr:TatD family hydrolase [Opitutaceae bacterium]
MIAYYDAHNHFQDDWLKPYRSTIAEELVRIGLRAAVVNGTCEGDWTEVAELAKSYSWVRPSFGLHPWDAGNRSEAWKSHFEAVFDRCPRAAVGEIGLDRWILDRAKPDDPRLAGMRRAPLEEQQDVFLWQLAFATKRNLPATVHCLDAWGALDAALREVERPERGFLLHAYGGPAEMVRGFVRLGAYFSFNGYFLRDTEPTSNFSGKLPNKLGTFKSIPLDRLLMETDAPAMGLPQAWSNHALPSAAEGSAINHPANIEAAYRGLAAVRGLTVEALAVQVGENFKRFFGI